MLKFKEPIKLKTGLQLCGATESFYKRLSGNYGLMSARVSPKDLLFLLTQPPEIPENLFGATQFNISNNVTDARRVTMEVVNNVVNRILLSTHPNFTYQDQVYITTMLNKLGVTDVNHFMQEVRRIREEQTDQIELTKLYRQEINRTIKSAKNAPLQQNINIINVKKESEKPVSPAPRYYLHQDIYNRLETGDIYEEINNIHRSSIEQNTNIARNELRLAEQMRVSRDLQLTEAKHTYFSSNAPTMNYHINHYEQGDVLPPPTTEEEVISQAAQAALFSTVERVITQTLSRDILRHEPWLEIKNSLHQTAENSLSRFESYHNDPNIRNYYDESYNEWYKSIVNEEKTTLRQLRQTNIEMQQLQHININEPQQIQPVFPPVSPAEKPQHIIERSHELESRLQRITELEREVNTQREQERLMTILEPQISTEKQTVINSLHETLRRETERRTQETIETTDNLQTVERELKTVEQQYHEQLPPVEQETIMRESADLITRELKEIDRQNRERLERMQIVREQMQQRPKSTPPDPRRTMKEALRALESPELVLKELEEHKEQPKISKESDAIKQVLSHTDSTTRQILEAVMMYERDPQAAIASGLVQLNDIGAFNAETAKKMTAPVVTEHPKPQIPPEQREQAARQTSKTLESFTEQPAQRAVRQNQPGKWDEAPIVFRREDRSSVEELVERLEEQRTQSLQQQNIHEDVIRQNMIQTETHDQTSKVIAHTTEDITEIVNRQMARQMNTITDQVYRQMERKLQTERTRRGRF